MWRIAVLLQVSACSLYFPDQPLPPETPKYELIRTHSISGELPIAGIDSDGTGGLWILYDHQIGNFGEPADIRIVHVDAGGHKLSEWSYPDEYYFVAGIAYGGDTLFIGYDIHKAAMSGAVRAIDARTGAERGRFVTELGFVDLAFRDGDLLISNIFNVVIAVDPSTGGERWRFQGPPFTQSTQAGIATVGDYFWLSSWMDGAEAALQSHFALVDRAGDILGTAHAAMYDAQTYAGLSDGMQLAWDGTHLIVQWRNQITWYETQR